MPRIADSLITIQLAPMRLRVLRSNGETGSGSIAGQWQPLLTGTVAWYGTLS